MLDDCLAPNLHLVICGDAVGRVSAKQESYYADPRNKFWRALHAVGLTPRELRPSEYSLLISFGVGLTDLVKGQAGTNRVIDYSRVDYAAFEQMIRNVNPRVLCFNGKNAASEFLGRKSPKFGRQPDLIGDTLIYVASSTSGSACRYWDITTWREVADAAMAGAAR